MTSIHSICFQLDFECGALETYYLVQILVMPPLASYLQ